MGFGPLESINNALRKKPGPDERENIDVAHEKADPTAYSPLPLQGLHVVDKQLSHSYDIVEEKKRPGQRYYEVTDKGLYDLSATEQVVARLLKGVINVADITKSKPGLLLKQRAYSKEMPLEKIETPTSDAELAADITILQRVFSDWDHYMPEHLDHNLLRDKEGRTAHYDFGKAAYLFYPPKEARFMVALAREAPLNDEAKAILSRKALELTERFSDRKFVEAVIRQSGKDMFSLFQAYTPEMRKAKDPVGLLQATLLERLAEFQ